MLRILTELFESLRGAPAAAGGEDEQHLLELATAVLLVEVMRADGHVDEAERQAARAALSAKFTLAERELDELFELARQRSEDTHDLYTYTEQLNRQLDEGQRLRVFELLWAVAWADGRADAHESHLLRRLADLLHVRHADAIGAKLRAEQRQRSGA